MGKVLCVYCTRTGLTRKLLRGIAKELKAETVRITDGRNYAGAIGYTIAAVKGLFGIMTELQPYKTKLPLNEYDHIILAAPIWAEVVCPMAKSFLAEIGQEFNGDVSYVITHMSNLPYDREYAAMDAYLKKPHVYDMTVSTKNDDMKEKIIEFVQKFKG